MQRIAVIGTGYVGLVTGTCFADLGNIVMCVDVIEEKITTLNQGKSPIYEPGLETLIQKNLHEQRLFFTTNASRAIQLSDIVFLCLPTPPKQGRCDTSYIFSTAKDIAKAMDGYKIIVIKSTVPPGTGKKVEEEIKKYTSHSFTVMSNPEFLKEGHAVEDFMRPDRVVIGTEDPDAAKLLTTLYEPVTINNHPIYVVRRESAEEAKYASNVLLASRISFINEEAKRCEAVGADIKEVALIVGADNRIGPAFLHAGPGFGGSCFPKDTEALITDSKERGLPARIAEATLEINRAQKIYAAKKIESAVMGLEGKKVAVWGVAFKANTDDIRESPALTIISYLYAHGATITVHDPRAMENMKKAMPTIQYGQNKYDICRGADVLVILTEWNDYRDPDFGHVKSLLKAPVIVDLRNLYYRKRHELEKLGFCYIGMGI